MTIHSKGLTANCMINCLHWVKLAWTVLIAPEGNWPHCALYSTVQVSRFPNLSLPLSLPFFPPLSIYLSFFYFSTPLSLLFLFSLCSSSFLSLIWIFIFKSKSHQFCDQQIETILQLILYRARFGQKEKQNGHFWNSQRFI